MPNQKLYVIVDSKLSMSHQAVQAAHAVAEYCLTVKTPWMNGTLVVLKAENLQPYMRYAQAVFREPDLDNRVTAIAALGINELVKNLPLI